MYSIQNEGKSVVAERFIRTLKAKTYKYMTSVSKNKYNNKYHSTIQMKPSSVKDNTYIDFVKKSNDKDSKFKVVDYVRIPKYKNIFAERYTPN